MIQPQAASPAAAAEEDLLRWLPDIVFGADPEGALGLPDAIAGVAAALDAPPELAGVAARMVRRLRGESVPCPPMRFVKCGHNHVTAFRWRGRQLAHKLYGNPWGCVRECAARLHAVRSGLPGVTAPLCIVGMEEKVKVKANAQAKAEAGLLAAAVFPWHAAREDGEEMDQRLDRDLGLWTRRLHDSLPAGVRRARRGRPFSLRRNQMLDLAPLMDSAVAPPAHWQQLEQASRRWLARAGDEGDALVHNDLGTAHHLRVDPDAGVVEVLDFEFAQIGYRTMDLLWVREARRAAFSSFLEGYDWEGAAAVLPLLEIWGSLARVVEAAQYVYNPPSPCACPRPAMPAPRLDDAGVLRLFAEHSRLLERWS